MKKVIFAALMLTLNATAIFAQEEYLNHLSANRPNDMILGKSESKVIAMRNFKKQFTSIDNETWSSKEDGLRARFKSDNIGYMVDYNMQGKWVSTIRIYDQDNLRFDMRKVVKSNYSDYDIVKVIEVRIGNKLVHFIKLESPSTLLTLHIMNGEITETERYTRG